MNNMTLNITTPLKYDFFNMDVKAVQILLGQNNAGKSFILATSWFLNFIWMTMAAAHKMKQVVDLDQLTQYVHDGTFSQGITGMVCGHYNEGSLKTSFIDGKLVNVSIDGQDKVKEIANVQYMSAAMRTFTAINMYLSIRGPLADVEKLGKTFKLYDILYIEGLIAKMPVKVTEEIKKRFEGFDIENNIEKFGVDLEKGEFYAIEDERRKSLSLYANGYQSLFNMILGTV